MHACEQRTIFRLRAFRVVELAKVGVGFEHDLLRPAPRFEVIRPRPDRMLHHPSAGVAVGGDHLTRHGRTRCRRQIREQVVRGVEKPETKGVAVDGLGTLERCLVIELAVLLRRIDRFLGADQSIVEDLRVARAQPRIDQPLERVHIVGGRQLALLSLERRVVRKVDSGPDFDSPRQTVCGNLR